MIFRRLPKPESFEHIRVGMLSKWLLESGDKATVIALTSRSGGEGVTTVAAGLARAFGTADPGGILVLDAAPSRLRVADLLKIKGTPVSFYNVEAGSLDMASAVVRDSKHGVDILALSEAGPSRPGSTVKARTIVDQLRPNYRVILLDAGPLSNGWAAPWLACSNYRVLVIDASKATREVLEHQKKQFDQGGVVLDGSILNKRVYPIPKALYWLAQ